MIKKSEKTKLFILEKARPIFNKHGYTGASLSDISKATGLTKGAIYGNFANKEELALASFNYNVRYILDKIRMIIKNIHSPLARLYALTNFYREYYKYNIDFGGCPILNVGIDANHTHPKLFTQVKKVFTELSIGIEKILIDGQNQNEIKLDINTKLYATRILSQIEGAIFTATMFQNELYLIDMMNHLDKMIKNELQK